MDYEQCFRRQAYRHGKTLLLKRGTTPVPSLEGKLNCDRQEKTGFPALHSLSCWHACCGLPTCHALKHSLFLLLPFPTYYLPLCPPFLLALLLLAFLWNAILASFLPNLSAFHFCLNRKNTLPWPSLACAWHKTSVHGSSPCMVPYSKFVALLSSLSLSHFCLMLLFLHVSAYEQTPSSIITCHHITYGMAVACVYSTPSLFWVGVVNGWQGIACDAPKTTATCCCSLKFPMP